MGYYIVTHKDHTKDLFRFSDERLVKADSGIDAVHNCYLDDPSNFVAIPVNVTLAEPEKIETNLEECSAFFPSNIKVNHGNAPLTDAEVSRAITLYLKGEIDYNDVVFNRVEYGNGSGFSNLSLSQLKLDWLKEEPLEFYAKSAEVLEKIKKL